MKRLSLPGRIGAFWGVLGVQLILAYAVVRLASITLEALQMTLDWRHWLVLAANAVFMAYSEGYKGFHLNWAPRVVARARYLAAHPAPVHVLLAPLFCMAYFHASRRRLISVYLLTSTIIALIVAFNHIPQPWRGLLDAGVVVGLTWGIASVVLFSVTALMRDRFDHSPDLPMSS